LQYIRLLLALQSHVLNFYKLEGANIMCIEKQCETVNGLPVPNSEEIQLKIKTIETLVYYFM